MMWGKYKDFSREDKIPDFPYFEYFWTHEVKNKPKKIFKISERYDPFSWTEDSFRKRIEGQFLENLFLNFHHWRSYAGKMKSLTEKIEHFQKHIDMYISNHNRKAAEIGGIKTVRKRDGDKHFRWLIDYQIPEVKTFEEIGNKSFADRKAISRDVRGVAKILDLTLRKSTRGRPPN